MTDDDPPRSATARAAAELALVRVVHHYGGRPEFVLLGGLVPALLCAGPPRRSYACAPATPCGRRPVEDHWHGGTAENVMCHIAMLESGQHGDGTTWLESVSDEEYQAASAG